MLLLFQFICTQQAALILPWSPSVFLLPFFLFKSSTHESSSDTSILCIALLQFQFTAYVPSFPRIFWIIIILAITLYHFCWYHRSIGFLSFLLLSLRQHVLLISCILFFNLPFVVQNINIKIIKQHIIEAFKKSLYNNTPLHLRLPKPH
jgi:hypothetical protein